MARTVSRLQGDQPFSDMMIPLIAGADIVQVTGSGGASAMTKIAAGEYSLRTSTASQAYVFMGGCSSLVFRNGLQDDYQEAFGSSRAGGSAGLPIGFPQTLVTASTVAGTSVTLTVMSSVNFFVGQKLTVDTSASGVQEFTYITSIPSGTSIVVASLSNSHTANFPISGNLFTTPGPRTGRPPFTGLSQLTPQTSAPLKGINIQQLVLIYAVNTTAITVPTVGMYAAQYFNNVAPTITTLITQATNNLATAAQTNPYMITVPVPVANQGFVVTPNTVVTVEFDFTTASTGNVDVIAFILNGQYNYD
jgi:hypothetical protein